MRRGTLVIGLLAIGMSAIVVYTSFSYSPTTSGQTEPADIFILGVFGALLGIIITIVGLIQKEESPSAFAHFAPSIKPAIKESPPATGWERYLEEHKTLREIIEIILRLINASYGNP